MRDVIEAAADDNPFDDDNEYECGDENDEFYDCGLMPNGQCMNAGSEDCDWDCPHSHGPLYAGSKAWGERHDAGVPIDGCECCECNDARKEADAIERERSEG